jgi:hypothetical protein
MSIVAILNYGGRIPDRRRESVDMKAFICKWTNGAVTVVTAPNRRAAAFYLDQMIDDVPIASIKACPPSVVVTVKRSGVVDRNWSDMDRLRENGGAK